MSHDGRVVIAPDGTEHLRRLAGRGELGGLTPAERRSLYGAAYTTVYPIVFNVVTRRVERGRGHRRCAYSVRHLAGDCLDNFYDDVEAMVQRLLTVTSPIMDLEAWVARCARNAAIDAYRRRRAARGALQRPRMSKVIAARLPDPWLQSLALRILVWVGVPAGAGASLWPLEAWSHDRATITGDADGSTPARVAADIDHVLQALRTRPRWYADHVEEPLGRKLAPTGGSPGDGPHDPRPLVVTEPDEMDRDRAADLASIAIEAIQAGLRLGDDPQAVVVRVVGTLFAGDIGADGLDRVPTGAMAPDELVSGLLADATARPALVERIMRIVSGE